MCWLEVSHVLGVGRKKGKKDLQDKTETTYWKYYSWTLLCKWELLNQKKGGDPVSWSEKQAGGGGSWPRSQCWMAETLDSIRCRVPIFPLWRAPRTGLMERVWWTAQTDWQRWAASVFRGCEELLTSGGRVWTSSFRLGTWRMPPCFSNDHMQCPKALGDVQPNGASEIWPWLSRVNGHGLDSHASGWEGAAELVKQGWDETALSRGEVKRRRKWHCGNRRTRIAEVESARKSSQQLCAVGVPQRWLTVHALPSASFCSHMPASLSLLCGGFLCLTVSPSLKQNQVALIGASPHLGWYIIMLLKW